MRMEVQYDGRPGASEILRLMMVVLIMENVDERRRRHRKQQDQKQKQKQLLANKPRVSVSFWHRIRSGHVVAKTEQKRSGHRAIEMDDRAKARASMSISMSMRLGADRGKVEVVGTYAS